jgi:DnaJ-class molecular chaperone
MSNWQSQNYYEILEIKPSAAEHEIHEAYQRAKATYSVDSPALYTMFTPQEAQALNRLIEEAYSVLGNQRLRHAYDSKLQNGEVATTSKPDQKNPPTAKAAQLATESGFGKTKFGTFKINDDFEREIQASMEFEGNLIKRVREYKEITIDQIAEFTRINRSHLEAIENNDYTTMPAPVFVRGFLAQVSRLLGLDENKVTRTYLKRYKDSLGKK